MDNLINNDDIDKRNFKVGDEFMVFCPSNCVA